MPRNPSNEDTTNQIQALLEISRAITSEQYIDDVLKLIMTVVANVTGAKICSLLLLDEEKGELTLRATQSMDKAYRRKPNLRLGEGIAGRVAQRFDREVRKGLFNLLFQVGVRHDSSSHTCIGLIQDGNMN